jgi:hypothetical protein
MLDRRRYSSHIQTLQSNDAKVASDSRKLVATSLELLRAETADTFLGRKTQEPFPKHEPKEKAGD